jgi:hypothetical protein
LVAFTHMKIILYIYTGYPADRSQPAQADRPSENENTAKNSGVLLLLLFAYDQKIFKQTRLSCLKQTPVCFFILHRRVSLS